MKIGDLVVRTYGEGRRPIAIVVGWYSPRRTMALIRWVGYTRVEQIGTDYLEILSEVR